MRNEPEAISDEGLMRRFYACDSAAFETLAERWWVRIHRFIIRLGFSDEDASDLTQDTLVRLFVTKETQSFDLGEPVAPFVQRAARNAAIGAWRRRHRGIETVPLLDELDRAEPDDDRRFCEDVLDCLGSLPEPGCTYIKLCKIHGIGDLSHNEIGEMLGKWPAQVTRISQKARGELRKCLEGKGYGG